MSWNYRKSVRLFGGLRMNLSKSGVGFSAGVRGARVGINAKGRKYSQLSIPGTGIYNRQYYKGAITPLTPKTANHLNSAIVALIILAGIVLLLIDLIGSRG